MHLQYNIILASKWVANEISTFALFPLYIYYFNYAVYFPDRKRCVETRIIITHTQHYAKYMYVGTSPDGPAHVNYNNNNNNNNIWL